mgnify:FL=1
MRGQIKTGGDEKREIPRMRMTENSEERKEEQEGRQPVSNSGKEQERTGARRILYFFTLNRRMSLLILVTAIPLTCMVLGIVSLIREYSASYATIMSNLRIANEYNMKFKEDMEYSMYRVMIGLLKPEQFQDGDIIEGRTQYATIVKNPYNMIESARRDFESIERERGSDRDIKIRGLLSCLDSLETAVNKLMNASKETTPYDVQQSIWENDIQGLCSMIQDYINQYIYYETLRMERLQKDLETQTTRLLMIYLVLLAAVLTVGFAIAAAIARSVTGPVKDLTETARRLGQGDLKARAAMSGMAEINVLARTFNIMSDEIAGLMDKTRREQENLRVMELKLRQEQINPHFLYNTLDSIVWMAEGGNNRQVVEMTSDLSDFFRTVLSEGHDFITIAEEEQHIRSYLKIQKIRYEDVLDYRIEMEERIRSRVVLKMILQPIVENALYHGIKNKRGGGTISIRGYEDKNGIVFEVEDDGTGMDQETLSKLREKIKSGREGREEPVRKSGGFGLSNVAQRLSMYYGESSALVIESEKGVGTCVKLYLGQIPLSRREDEKSRTEQVRP